MKTNQKMQFNRFKTYVTITEKVYDEVIKIFPNEKLAKTLFTTKAMQDFEDDFCRPKSGKFKRILENSKFYCADSMLFFESSGCFMSKFKMAKLHSANLDVLIAMKKTIEKIG